MMQKKKHFLKKNYIKLFKILNLLFKCNQYIYYIFYKCNSIPNCKIIFIFKFLYLIISHYSEVY
jgi:hypothetical protein